MLNKIDRLKLSIEYGSNNVELIISKDLLNHFFYHLQNSFISHIRMSTSIIINIFSFLFSIANCCHILSIVFSYIYIYIYISTLTNHSLFFLYIHILMSKTLVAVRVTIINKKIRTKTKENINSRHFILVRLKNVNILDIEKMDND